MCCRAFTVSPCEHAGFICSWAVAVKQESSTRVQSSSLVTSTRDVHGILLSFPNSWRNRPVKEE